MRFHLESTSRKSQLNRAIKPVLESLENRRMLTIVEGGQIAFYQNLAGQAVKVVVDGSGSLAFIGSSQDANGRAQLNDIPMTIFQDGVVVRENLGGFGGRDGIEVITDVTGWTGPEGDGHMESNSLFGPYAFVPSANVAFEALGTNTLGRTYAIARRTTGGASANNPAYDVVGVNNNNGRIDVLDSVAGKILAELQAEDPEFNAEDMGDLIGADFDLSNPDVLYFALNVDFPFRDGDSIQRKEVPAMFTYNIRTEAVALNSFFGVSSNEDEFQINDFTFVDEDNIAFFGSVKFGDEDAQEGLFLTNKNNIGPNNFSPIVIGTGDDADELTEIAAMESIDGNFIIAVTDRTENADMVRIDISGPAVRASLIGPVVDPDVPTTVENKRGESIGDLAYNSRLVDQYFQPGKRGVLLGADTLTDELVGLDLRQRFPNSDIFAIVDAEATVDTSVLITAVTPSTNQNLSFDQRLLQGVNNPYGGGGSLGTLMVNEGQDAPAAIGLGNGAVYIGGRSNDADDRPIVPLLTVDLANEPEMYVGTLPGVKLPRTLTAGVHIDGSINDIFIAGTITGRVNINGSVDTFYAGNIVTGDVWSGAPDPLETDNFFVAGDLRNLIVAGGIGSLAGAPGPFNPVTDFAIGGRVMQIKTGFEFRGGLDVVGKTGSVSNRDVVQELETVVRATGNNVANAFSSFQLANQGFARNDGFDEPQILGAVSDSRGRGGSVVVNGSLNNGNNFNDNRDVYALPVLAGEGASIQVLSQFGDVNLEVYDPEGRLYHTDFSNQNEAYTFNTAINFTADKPGLWRIVAAPVTPGIKVNAARPYQLTLNRIGAISLGGLVSSNSIILNNPTIGVRVRSGDMGAILAGDELYGANTAELLSGRDSTFANPIIAQRGNIRVIEAGNISHLENGVLSGYPTVIASGNIGMIHSDDRLYINDALYGVNILTTGKPSAALTTGGNIQTIEAGGNFSGILSVNGGIGVIRAGSIDAITTAISGPSYFQINADNRGNDELGLIDVVGQWGNFATGGPALSTGNGGNIRYMRVGGSIYRDQFFGIGSTFVQTATNDSITVTDDSGAEVSVKPITQLFTTTPDTTTGGGGGDTTTGGGGTDTTGSGGIPDPFGNPDGIPDPFGGGGTGGLGGIPDPFGEDPVITDPTDPDAGVPDGAEVLGQIRLDTYPVRSGGFVITHAESSTGITVATNRQGGGGIVDITRIVTGVRGTPLTLDAAGNLVALPTVIDPTQPLQDQLDEANRFLDVILVGNSRVNVLELRGALTGAEGANYTRIDNYTDGEIVNVNAASIAVLTGEWLGVARPVANTKIEGVENVADARFGGVATLYPFNNAKNMIFVTTANTIGARGPMGNITIQQRVNNLVANAGNQNVKGVFEGIVAPVLVLTNNVNIEGNIDRIEIGEGLAYSGSGEVALSGLYSTDELGTISNFNGGGDLRGDVIARTYIHRINLVGNGSILDADIYATNVGVDGRALLPGVTPANGFQVGLERIDLILGIGTGSTSPTDPEGVGKITISGRGGMMNARVVGYNVGKVTANRGSFGVFTSSFYSTTGGTMGGISADGLGIRAIEYSGGSFTGDLIATGNGRLRSVDEFTRSARASETGLFDGSSGVSLTPANDLNLYLGTDSTIRSIAGTTNDGYVEDSVIQSNRSIRSIQGFEIRVVSNPLEARPRDETYPMQINTGGDLALVRSQRGIDGLRIVAGTVGTIQSGFDLKNFQLQTTGFVNEVLVKRHFLGSSNLNLINSGSINRIVVGGNMNGTAYAAKGFRSISIGGNLRSARDQGGIYTSQSINLLEVNGDILSGAYVKAKNVIKRLAVGGDIQAGAEVLAKAIQSKQIAGDVDGSVS